ncbi:COG4705 family protein [Fictibacillus barbaricus]|uniref:Membrane-anchored protein n=1 Tax=Fictibacillus barbaricus TaxID=182136 RepID=A0ABU1TW87_9BACL|nr:hypothetical protein [Fictibacillus barbaricus]MDR7071468.1 putative membrane-anchored protein [Fictibacillus barbaricus]
MEYNNDAKNRNVQPPISDKLISNPSKFQQLFNKVPQITVFFWIIKIMATTVGETAADFLSFNLKWGLTNTTYLMSVLLVISLIIQFKAKKYVPWKYWLVVVLISIVGTLVTDNLVDHFGVALQTTTIFFTIALLVTFIAWYRSEKTLSIHSIYTKKREAFYWMAILFTFALGTAAGDLIAEGLHLGYLVSGFIFVGLIAVVIIGYYMFKLNAVWAFWIAYILTRPLGASFGDLLSQPHKHGGLGLGTTGTSIIFLVIILSLVVYLTRTKRDEIPTETITEE